jgi:hypothetical protein
VRIHSCLVCNRRASAAALWHQHLFDDMSYATSGPEIMYFASLNGPPLLENRAEHLAPHMFHRVLRQEGAQHLQTGVCIP